MELKLCAQSDCDETHRRQRVLNGVDTTYRYECRCVFSCHFSGEIVCHNMNMDTVAYRCVLTNALTAYLIS